MDAEARMIQLEADIEAANQRLSQLSQAREPSPPLVTPIRVLKRAVPAAAPTAPAASRVVRAAASQPPPAAETGAGWAVTAAPPPVVGPLVRYAAFSSQGLTNLVRIEGTSSLRPWQVESPFIGGSAELGQGFPAPPEGQAPGEPVEVKVSVFIPVRSLKSVRQDGQPYSSKMDEMIYDTLREPTNKRITYTLTTLTLTEPSRGVTEPVLYQAKGSLCVAGVTNTITMPVAVTLDPAGWIQFAGSVKVKMTDFKIEPPSPKLSTGAIKTGDEVTLRFGWWVRRVGAAQASM